MAEPLTREELNELERLTYQASAKATRKLANCRAPGCDLSEDDRTLNTRRANLEVRAASARVLHEKIVRYVNR